MENVIISVVFIESIVIIVMMMYINYLQKLIKDRERIELVVREVDMVLKKRIKDLLKMNVEEVET
ncbi:TPA: hypothetical protein V1A32_002050 [Streptococcus pneumoniae]|nr:hypothetical protein [Streptococcus pneumoniae]